MGGGMKEGRKGAYPYCPILSTIIDMDIFRVAHCYIDNYRSHELPNATSMLQREGGHRRIISPFELNFVNNILLFRYSTPLYQDFIPPLDNNFPAVRVGVWKWESLGAVAEAGRGLKEKEQRWGC